MIKMILSNFTVIFLKMLSRHFKYLFSISKQDRIVFFGSGKVAFPSLKCLHANYPKLEVVTQSSLRQKKLFNEVEKYCQQQKVSFVSPITNKESKQKRSQQWTEYLKEFGEADFGVVCSYGYMLPARLIQRFKKGLIVVHPSLLPKYRGGSPIFHAIANGEQNSGISYIEISKGAFDEGKILHQVETKINRNDDYAKVQEQLAQLASKDLPYVLQNLDKLRPGKSQQELKNGIPQQLLKAPLMKTKDVNLSMPAQSVYNWIRAFMAPKFHFLAKDNHLIIKVSDEYLQGQGEVGSFKVSGKKLYVRCGDKFIRVTGWYQPSKRENNPGLFIAEYIKSGKYSPQKVRIQ